MLKDIDIREALLDKIKAQNDNHGNYRIIPEMAVCDGEARVDVAVANGRLCGYEIKSDADTLERLPSQVECYNRTFDKIIIVVGLKFAQNISDNVPEYWGISVAYKNKNGNLTIKQIRKPKVNRSVEAKALLELLWRDEIIELLKLNNISGCSGKNRRILRKVALEEICKTNIKNYTRETLKHRDGWR